MVATIILLLRDIPTGRSVSENGICRRSQSQELSWRIQRSAFANCGGSNTKPCDFSVLDDSNCAPISVLVTTCSPPGERENDYAHADQRQQDAVVEIIACRAGSSAGRQRYHAQQDPRRGRSSWKSKARPLAPQAHRRRI